MPDSSAGVAFAPTRTAGVMAGEMLRAARMNQRLTMRQVVIATKRLATQLDNDEFAISLGHLSEIERRDMAPNIYRLYSLAKVYNLDLLQLLTWFGIPAIAPLSQPGPSAKTARVMFDFPNKV